MKLGHNRLIATLACATALPLATAASDWPRWRGPDLNGISRETGWTTLWPKEGPKQLWKANVGIGFSSVAVADGRLFTLGHANESDTVFCFHAETGAMLWKHSYPCPLDAKYYEGGPGSTPTVAADRVYTLSKRGHLFCFDAGRGTPIWQTNLMTALGAAKPEWGFAGSPLVEDDLLLLNVGSAGTAVDRKTGRVVWTSGREMAGYATPVPWSYSGQRCALIFASKALVAVNAARGTELWRLPWVTRWNISAADPNLAGDRVFISTFDQGGALWQLGPGKPAELWRCPEMGNHFNSCVLVGDHLYGFDGNTDKPHPELRCVSFQTGKVQWSQRGLGMGSLMAADAKLIILSDAGLLVVAEASPAAFKPLAQAQVLGGKCWTVPVLSNGRIYGRNAKGDLVCVDVRGSPVAKPEGRGSNDAQPE
jgi:outer membrane protein assembly factor BamB